MTHTYAILEISAEAFDEISRKLNDAGYYTAFDEKGTQIDMEGIALVRKGGGVALIIPGHLDEKKP